MNIEKIIREYIDKTIHMSVATASDNKPWVCELHFVYDDNLNLYFRSLASRRHSQEIAANPNVAGNIIRQHGPGEYPHGIYFEGKSTLIESQPERENIFPLFQQRFSLNEKILEEAEQSDGHQFYKIVVANWYAFGKFDGDSFQKYQLKWNGGKRFPKTT